MPSDTSLQFASDIITICVHLQILQNAPALITNCADWIYYKMLHTLLHNAQIITKCRNRYYKMRNLLQNASLLQNAAEHYVRKYHTNQNGNFNANKLSSFLLDKTVKLLYEKEIGSKER